MDLEQIAVALKQGEVSPGQVKQLLKEVRELRQALWDCYMLSGGEAQAEVPNDLDSSELAPMVIDCVHDLRAHFEAARVDR